MPPRPVREAVCFTTALISVAAQPCLGLARKEDNMPVEKKGNLARADEDHRKAIELALSAATGSVEQGDRT
jgi:hypothetical protein